MDSGRRVRPESREEALMAPLTMVEFAGFWVAAL
jgi:hypothetical protein